MTHTIPSTRRDVYLRGYFRTRSPLSHIGETISATAYLVQEPVMQLDGSIEEVFTYSGNAWRGQLRDLAATYLLRTLGDPMIALDAFHLLYSGGRIGGEQTVDIAKARRYRELLPAIALWGGGVGSQIIPGKMRVQNSYPVCREAPKMILPSGMRFDLPDVDFQSSDEIRALRHVVSYRQLTTEKSFSRKDDSKDDRLIGVLPNGEDGHPSGKAKRDASGPADQMRMTVEVIIAGAVLTTQIDLLDVSDVEIGCLVSALHMFAKSPHIGGQAGKGHGLVDLVYVMQDMETNETWPLIAVTEGRQFLGEAGALMKDAYDQYLRLLYDAMLESNASEIVKMLGVEVAQ